jgi:8-oxo-dGTP diphosphatase
MKIVTAAVIVRNGHVLVTRRAPGEKLAGLWEFPGGKLESGETLQQCLARELKEELGINVSVGDIVAESEYHYDHGTIRLVALRTEILSGNLELTVHDRAEWVAPAAFERLPLAPADLPIARTLKELGDAL